MYALDIDCSSLMAVSSVTGQVRGPHSWARPGFERLPPLDIVQISPWAMALAQAGRPVVFARLSEAPPEDALGSGQGRRRPPSMSRSGQRLGYTLSAVALRFRYLRASEIATDPLRRWT